MKKIIEKFKELAKNIFKNRKKEINIIEKNINEPVVYVNKPINNYEEDILGVQTHINRIDNAIENGANVIGIIGDYGTGKSSLIELLKNKYSNAITINMWNNSYTEINNENKTGITDLTKNFLFQMAIGEDTKFAQYINKKLSKNYGILSIMKSGKRFWLYFVFAIIFWGMYKICAQLPVDIYETSIYKSLNNCLGNNFFPDGFWQTTIFLVYGILVNCNMIFAIVAILLIIKAVLKTTIVFSLWDSQGKREPDVNDIYDIYLEIAKKITDKNGKRVIIIEDLDRTNKIESIREFIKEIYRFNNVLPKELSNKLIFIIEVKSEEAMKELEKQFDIEEIDTNGLYKKVFYFKVRLNPIHNSDYQEILFDLLKQQEIRLKENLGITLQETLPEEFAYIVKGKNLTIRDLKERLNRSFEIYENLVQKGEKTGALIDYKKCAIVAYLESTYPTEMQDFISDENRFSKILEQSYVIKQKSNISLTEKIEAIRAITLKGSSNEFTDEIAVFIANDLIDEDFRMYFYNYPKGQRIKSAEEINVENLILYPSQNEVVEEEKIIKAVEKNPNVIINAYERRKKEKLVFPRIIFQSEILYRTALNGFYDKVLETLEKDVKWKTENKVESGKIIKKICNYNIDSKQLIEEYSEILINDFKELTEKEVIGARMEIINATSKYLLAFKSIFVNDELPLISKEELELIEDIQTKMQLINEDIIDENDAEYIIDVLNDANLKKEDIDRAVEIYCGMDNTVVLDNIVSSILEFLKINNIVENKLFEPIARMFIKTRESIEESELVNYLNSLNVKDLTEEYIQEIDDMKIAKKLSNEILAILSQKGLNNTLWINLILENRTNELNLEDDIEEKLELIDSIVSVLGEDIVILRKEIIKRALGLMYKNIFFESYPIISLEEINLLNDVNTIKQLVDFSRVEEDLLDGIVTRINQTYSTKEELVEVIEIFDRTKTSNNLKDISLVKRFFDNFEWKKELIKDLTDEQRSYIYRILKDFLRLTDINYAVAFSYEIGYIIKEIDNQLYIQAKNNTTYYNEYMELANEIDIPTEQTITNIINFGKECRLNRNLSNAIWENGYYTKSIIGKVLWDEQVSIEHAKSNIDEYVEAYMKTIEAHDIMASNNEFLQEIIDKDLFYNIKTKNKLLPFYKLRQPIKLVRYIFETLSDSDILEYIKTDWELNTEEDSLEFQKLICDEKYIKYIENQEVYEIVKFKLWKASHKTLLTRARNKKFYN